MPSRMTYITYMRVRIATASSLLIKEEREEEEEDMLREQINIMMLNRIVIARLRSFYCALTLNVMLLLLMMMNEGLYGFGNFDSKIL